MLAGSHGSCGSLYWESVFSTEKKMTLSPKDIMFCRLRSAVISWPSRLHSSFIFILLKIGGAATVTFRATASVNNGISRVGSGCGLTKDTQSVCAGCRHAFVLAQICSMMQLSITFDFLPLSLQKTHTPLICIVPDAMSFTVPVQQTSLRKHQVNSCAKVHLWKGTGTWIPLCCS